MSELSDTLLLQIRIYGLPEPEQEYQFCKTRKWRADLAYPEQKLLIEVEGGSYQGGRHKSLLGFIDDCEKYNTAVTLGYRVLRFPAIHIMGGRLTRKKYLKAGVQRVADIVEPCAVRVITEALAVEPCAVEAGDGRTG